MSVEVIIRFVARDRALLSSIDLESLPDGVTIHEDGFSFTTSLTWTSWSQADSDSKGWWVVEASEKLQELPLESFAVIYTDASFPSNPVTYGEALAKGAERLEFERRTCGSPEHQNFKNREMEDVFESMRAIAAYNDYLVTDPVFRAAIDEMVCKGDIEAIRRRILEIPQLAPQLNALSRNEFFETLVRQQSLERDCSDFQED